MNFSGDESPREQHLPYDPRYQKIIIVLSLLASSRYREIRAFVPINFAAFKFVCWERDSSKTYARHDATMRLRKLLSFPPLSSLSLSLPPSLSERCGVNAAGKYTRV